jgi:hypothetical protein
MEKRKPASRHGLANREMSLLRRQRRRRRHANARRP